MSVNVERLRAELVWITEHPEQWDQEHWAHKSPCGTACCLAGWTVAHEPGARLIWLGETDDDELDDDELDDARNVELGGEPSPIWEAAARILRIDLDDSHDHPLFHPDNTLHDLWRIARDLTAGEIEIPESVAAQAVSS